MNVIGNTDQKNHNGINMNDFPSPIMILGMHRSGTSCLTGCLEEAGLFLGDVNQKAAFNAKGNRENVAIMKLHEDILKRVGASWDAPPQEDPVWRPEDYLRLKPLLEVYQDKPLWGLKDPRSLFMIDGWKKVSSPRFIGTFRNPVEVAHSLVHRAKIWKQDMDLEKAYSLWARYNNKLLMHYHERPFDIIRYDIDPADYEVKLAQMIENIGLEMPSHLLFKDEKLHNQLLQNKAVPDNLVDIWEALNDIAL